jgi:hypothetical protein
MTGKRFTLLFIRNDSHVRRFGLSVWGFALLLGIAAVVMAAALSGSYMAYVFWDRYRDLRDEHKGIRRQLEMTEQRLTRVSNLEDFLRQLDPDRLDTILSPALTQQGALADDQEEKGQRMRMIALGNVELRRSGPGRLMLGFEVSSLSGATVEGLLEIGLIMSDGRRVELDSDIIDGRTTFKAASRQALQVSFPGPDQPTGEISAIVLAGKDVNGTMLGTVTYRLSSILR